MNNQEMKSTTRLIKGLVGGYVAISLGALVALFLMSNQTQEAWVHGVIVAATSLLMALFARGVIKGRAKAYLRLRITTIIMVIAIAITTAIPGDFPDWMKVEQVVCGLLLVGAVIVLNSSKMRRVFASK